MEESRDRLANLRIVTLAALVAVFLYLAMAIAFVRRQSRVDPVTGLPNSQYLHSMRGVDPDKVIITCEILGFQLVLSDFGTEGGDDLLRVFTSKLKKQLRAGDELVQASPSGFVMFLEMSPSEDIEKITEQLVEATTFDWRTGDSVLHVSAVMGVDPQCQDNCPSWSIRYQRAHRALSQAQLEGRNYCINREDLRRRIEEDRLVHTGLIRFFNNEPGALHLSLVYQPIVSSENIHLLAEAGNPEALRQSFERSRESSGLSELYMAKAAIVKAGQNYGAVEIGLDLREQLQGIEQVKRRSLAIAGLEVLAAALFSIAAGHYLVRRLKYIRRVLAWVNNGEYSHKIEDTQLDEVSDVASEIDRLTERISWEKAARNRRITELEELNGLLLKKLTEQRGRR